MNCEFKYIFVFLHIKYKTEYSKQIFKRISRKYLHSYGNSNKISRVQILNAKHSFEICHVEGCYKMSDE